MINDNYGEFAQNPTLSQVRMQVGYDWSDLTEIGLWGAFRVLDDSRFVGNGFGTDTWRPIDQLSIYWNYLWGSGGANSFVWLGIPERDRLGGNGSLGDYFVGALYNGSFERTAKSVRSGYLYASIRSARTDRFDRRRLGFYYRTCVLPTLQHP